MTRLGPPLPRSLSRAAGAAWLGGILAACAPLPPADGPLRPWQVAEVERYAERLARSPQTLDDPALIEWIEDRLLRIDPEQGARIRAFVIDQPAPQADLVGGRLLRLRTGLLRELQSEEELLFVLAHEVAHRRLGHVAERESETWDPVAAEIEADLDARRSLQSLGLDDDAGKVLLERLASRLDRDEDLATIRRRVEALASPAPSSDALVEPYQLDEAQFARLLARYR